MDKEEIYDEQIVPLKDRLRFIVRMDFSQHQHALLRMLKVDDLLDLSGTRMVFSRSDL